MSKKNSGPQSVSARVELELLRTPPRPERADAARNRTKVLEAAAALVAEHGVAGVSMDAIAAAAGVGKGTLFRRFGDKAGLAAALLDKQERQLQDRIIFGEPPLGPGAEPAQRLLAFFDAYLDYVFAHLDLVRMSETAGPGARYRIGAYRFWHRHVTILTSDPVLAHTLLAPLGAEHLTAALTEHDEKATRRAILSVLQAVAAPTT
ncbi:MAG: TetR/AcrR family transcriptional regulator [Pseudomonas fluorescens]